MVTGINKLKILANYVSWKCEWEFYSRKWNNDKCWCECKSPKKRRGYKKDFIWNPATCSCKSRKFLESIIDDSVVSCNEIIEEIKPVSTIVNKKGNM